MLATLQQDALFVNIVQSVAFDSRNPVSSISSVKMEYSLCDSDDEEDEIFLAALTMGRPKLQYNRIKLDPFNDVDDETFLWRFRLTKETVAFVYERIKDTLPKKTKKDESVSDMTPLLVALRYYATGSEHMAVSEFPGVSASCGYVRLVSQTISAQRADFVRMPAGQEQLIVKEQFASLSFPNVIGVLSCEEVHVIPPLGSDLEAYKNCFSTSTGRFIVKFQAVSDARMRFLNVSDCWPGVADNAKIFHDSHLKVRFEKGEFKGCFLLADLNLERNQYVLSRLPHVSSDADQLYNECFLSAINSFQRSIYFLRNRFPVLSSGIQCKLADVPHIIHSTIVLHNIAVAAADPLLYRKSN